MGTRTIGAYTFDVYGTAAGLTEYATGSAAYYATFTAAATDDVARAHVEATRLISRLTFADTVDADPATSTDEVLLAACYELTLAALADPAVLTQTSASKNIKAITGKVGVEFFAPVVGGRFPARVMELLTGLLASGTDWAGAYVGGASECSDFDEADRYGVTTG